MHSHTCSHTPPPWKIHQRQIAFNKPAWYRLDEMYILNLDHFSELHTRISNAILYSMIPLNFSKKAKISMCPKLNSSLASRTTFFKIKLMSNGPTLGIYLMEICSQHVFLYDSIITIDKRLIK